jgi:hypothetical protein
MDFLTLGIRVPTPGRIVAALVVLLSLAAAGDRTVVHAQTSPISGFTDAVVLTGLTQPTVVSFSPDGRVFVGEKSGIIRMFDGLRHSAA